MVFLLLVAGVAARWYSFDPVSNPHEKPDLSEHLDSIPDWSQGKTLLLTTEIAAELDLDDYINNEYENGSGEVSLYIGQYHSSEKVGAAHDPMVCFPGQGWKVSEKLHGRIMVTKENKNYPISYATMITDSGNQKLFVLYWFQSADSAHSSTFVQKISSFMKTLSGRGQTNAFVRISTSLRNRSLPEAKSLCYNFIKDFYPLYLSYIHQYTDQEI